MITGKLKSNADAIFELVQEVSRVKLG